MSNNGTGGGSGGGGIKAPVYKLIVDISRNLGASDSDGTPATLTFATAFLSHYSKYLNSSQLYDVIDTPVRKFTEERIDPTKQYRHHNNGSTIVSLESPNIVGLLRLLCMWVRACFHDLRTSRHRLARLKNLIMDLTTWRTSCRREPLSRASQIFGADVAFHANRIKLALLSESKRHKDLRRIQLVDFRQRSKTLTTPLVPPEVNAVVATSVNHNTSSPRLDGVVAPKKLLSHDPKQIAEQLTFIDHQIFSSIPINDFLRKKNSAIKQFIERTDRMSYWVASNILAQNTLAAQTFAAQHFVQVAHWCEELGNYNAAFSILNGFSLWSTSRLVSLWNIKHQYRYMYTFMRTRLNPDKNFAAYRDMIRKRRNAGHAVPCVPYLAVNFRDLMFIEDGNPDWNIQGHPNVDKIKTVGSVLAELREFQRRSYGTRITPATESHLWVHLVHLYRRSEKYLEERSTQFRPCNIPATTGSSASSSTSSEQVSLEGMSISSSDSSSDVTNGSAFDEKELVDLNSGSSHCSAVSSEPEKDS